MTLANFNSNFNFQLRALQQAAECCGIVPSVPVPPVPDCLYYSEFFDSSGGCFSSGFWDFEGCLTDFTCFSSLYPNGYYVQDAAPIMFDGCSHLVVLSQNNTTPPDINYTNGLGFPAVQGWTPLCKFGCVQTTSFRPTNPVDRMVFCGISIFFSSYGGNLDFTDIPLSEIILFAAIRTYFPTCTGVNITDDGAGNITIQYFDIWWDDYIGLINQFSDGITTYPIILSACP